MNPRWRTKELVRYLCPSVGIVAALAAQALIGVASCQWPPVSGRHGEYDGTRLEFTRWSLDSDKG